MVRTPRKDLSRQLKATRLRTNVGGQNFQERYVRAAGSEKSELTLEVLTSRRNLSEQLEVTRVRTNIGGQNLRRDVSGHLEETRVKTSNI